jgi:hypothetical protein
MTGNTFATLEDGKRVVRDWPGNAISGHVQPPGPVKISTRRLNDLDTSSTM